MNSLNEQVLSELTEMKKVGIKVPAKLIKTALDIDLEEYKDMSISEIADLLIELY